MWTSGRLIYNKRSTNNYLLLKYKSLILLNYSYKSQVNFNLKLRQAESLYKHQLIKQHFHSWIIWLENKKYFRQTFYQMSLFYRHKIKVLMINIYLIVINFNIYIFFLF